MDTIFALATPHGKSGVAMIRISGTEAGTTLTSLTKRTLPNPREATLCRLYNKQGDALDQALILWFPAPQSFTGEDVAELHVHGSRAVIQSLLRELGSIKGLRPAEAGEFAKRAFENGKLDLVEAEGLADLIEAETRQQQRQAMRQMEGHLSALYEEWRKRLIALIAELEAYIDFPDEDLPADLKARVQSHAAELQSNIEAHLADRRGQTMRCGFSIALLGAPNAGKSSLLNILAQRDVAIVSHIAGTTRDVLEVYMDIGGFPVTFYDTAGLRETQDFVEHEGVRRAQEKADDADLKLLLFDAAQLPAMDPFTLEHEDHKSIRLFSRADLGEQKTLQALIKKGGMAISLAWNDSISSLLTTLEKEVATRIEPDEAPVFTRERHRQALQDVLSALTAFTSDWEAHKPIEITAEHLRQAARSLGKITGIIDFETILDTLFASFCIGK